MDLHKEIYNYLSTQKLMAVATNGKYPWIANVYYVHDPDLNLYFLSKQNREHCEALLVNSKVAVAIADSHQPIYEPQKGIQMWGVAEKVNVISRLEWMFKMWNKLISEGKKDPLANPQQFLTAGVSSVYKITPKRIKFFNTELWPKEQTQVLEL